MSTNFSHFLGPPGSARNISFIVTSSVATTLAVLAIARLALHSLPRKTIPSPRATLLPKLSPEEQDNLAYPPSVFPGARDVESPYGTIRVYEWGPQDGRKVLLIHGISTPCLALGGIANGLVSKGYRVMLLDLWGRGYSDSVDLPHDSRLYTTEILLALTSSSLAWTPGGFNLIGYSLGGGISADFAASFPRLVKSLVLLAPAGLIRPYHFGWQSRMMYNGLLPDRFVEWLVKRRLRAGPVHSNVQKKQIGRDDDAQKAINAEIQGVRSAGFESAPLLSKERPGVTVAEAVKWQLDWHDGFVGSFVSSIRFSSIQGRRETWKILGERGDKVLIVGGRTDPVIVPRELRDDAVEAIGEDGVTWREVDAGHEFPITRAAEVVTLISEAWDI